jgi:hypothetical protein
VPECASAFPADPSTFHPELRDHQLSADLVSAQTSTTAHASPGFGRAALAVLGTMLFLIVALTVLLVQSTWADSASAAESPPALAQASLGSR